MYPAAAAIDTRSERSVRGTSVRSAALSSGIYGRLLRDLRSRGLRMSYDPRCSCFMTASCLRGEPSLLFMAAFSFRPPTSVRPLKTPQKRPNLRYPRDVYTKESPVVGQPRGAAPTFLLTSRTDFVSILFSRSDAILKKNRVRGTSSDSVVGLKNLCSVRLYGVKGR